MVDETENQSTGLESSIRTSMQLNLAPEHQHRLAPLANKPAGQLLIHEIYRSIQGESTYAGLPCVFVRLTTCNVRCVWCDTPHAFKEGTLLSFEDVLQKVLEYNCPLVELTGGEPLLQEEAFELMSQLADRGKKVLLETSGTVPVDQVDRRVCIIMDLKCPDSGECDSNLFANFDHLKPTDEIKFVIASRRDFEWTVETIRKHRLDRRFEVLLSVVHDKVKPVQLVDWLLDSQLQVRMQLQMHKYIWDPKQRGV
jgi:7-carboxy-7-deazaguanine synthase